MVGNLLPLLLVLAVARLDAVDVAPEKTVSRARPAHRVESLDACRGVAIVGMLAANLVNVCLHDVPSALQHNWENRLHLFDFPAPLFQFLVGVSLPLFLAARRRAGRSEDEARLDAVRRFLNLILLGMVLDGIGALSIVPHWGVLQTLGLGGIVATALDGSPRLAWAVAAALLVAFSGPANGIVHARPDAALAFVPLTLAGAGLGATLARGGTARDLGREALRLAAVAFGLGVVLRVAGVPFSKVTGTSSFVLLACAASAATLAATVWLESAGGRFPDIWLRTGRSALTVWVLLNVCVYYPAWLVFPSWERLALSPGLAATAALTTALCATTLALDRRGIRVPI